MVGASGTGRRYRWHIAVPLISIAALVLAWNRDLTYSALLLLGTVLAAAVLSAVHHAEVVAARVGEPYGSLVLAVAVTVIEVALIVTLMASDPLGSQALARDTVLAALMITCNGIVGVSLLVRTLRGGEAYFNAAGAVSGLSAIAALATFSLVLPTFTTSTRGPTLTVTQLSFTAAAALLIYILFLLVQAVRHRDYFLPEPAAGSPPSDEGAHVTAPGNRTTTVSLVLLVVCLIAVVGLAKVTSPLIEFAVSAAGLPSAAVAVSIAMLVLLPESLAAVRAARRGRIQTSLNLAYGSAMASIGLTIPTIAVVTWLFGYPIVLGIDATSIVLLAATLFTALGTVLSGRATVLQAGIHLSLIGAFLVLIVSP